MKESSQQLTVMIAIILLQVASFYRACADMRKQFEGDHYYSIITEERAS